MDEPTTGHVDAVSRKQFREQFAEYMKDAKETDEFQQTVVGAHRNMKLANIGEQLLRTLDLLGLQMFKLDVVRKDRGADPRVVSDTAIARREVEADANKLTNDYLNEVIKQYQQEATQ